MLLGIDLRHQIEKAFWWQFGCLAKVCHGAVGFPTRLIDLGANVIAFHPRPQRNRPVEVGQRIGIITLRLQSQSAGYQGVGIIRLELQGLIEIGERPIKLLFGQRGSTA